MTTATRLIIDPPQPGVWNMSVDEALLEDAVANGIATLRFYQWNEPTLSLGYFQCYADREQHAASRQCVAVRRQSGGGAILHDRELTYSLSLPPGHPLGGHAPRLYEEVHLAFIAAIAACYPNLLQGKPLTHTVKIRGGSARVPPSEEPFLCFQRAAAGDIVFAQPGTAGAGRERIVKIMGSAQRRYHSAILQHGSLLLSQSPATPELPGLKELSGWVPVVGRVTELVVEQLATRLEMALAAEKMSAQVQSLARRIAKNKYGTEAWTKRR
ncbi:MAG: lipoate--protein ligase family protein [Pirellulales bacterium]|nr:lipoate--protein ligase family protein [Pirellulales bacterium]